MDAEKSLEVQFAAVRLQYLQRRNRLQQSEAALRAGEELGDGLHLIDFEQLKLENQVGAQAWNGTVEGSGTKWACGLIVSWAQDMRQSKGLSPDGLVAGQFPFVSWAISCVCRESSLPFSNFFFCFILTFILTRRRTTRKSRSVTRK
jgi:hypothetical protein